MIAVHLPPFESRYCQSNGSEGFFILYQHVKRRRLTPGGKNHSRQGTGFSPSSLIFLPPWRTSNV
ncbi:hypothetical protein ID850_17520 [Xenorhabdus sp. Flor]|uniref:hypothetical protein n=1 Tax=Xenorhabdus cabanillasii TaxID=351673 RepID=UPI0019B045D0|nr:hypothetical protein [Xenorhabdus sp. Flor]MBD2816498.1 hypothetical protein [Xenorhabdus sp. Flor]